MTNIGVMHNPATPRPRVSHLFLQLEELTAGYSPVVSSWVGRWVCGLDGSVG
jgi:hypothetical protein